MIVCPEVADPKDAIYWILLFIENLTTCLALVHITRLILVFGKTSLFHKNLARLSQALLISFYPNVAVRGLITLYEVGILSYDGCFNDVILTISICVFFIVYCTTCIILFRRDSAKLRAMDRNLAQKKVIYALSTKFQLKENLKVMKILMHQSIVVAVNAVIGCSLFVLITTVLLNYPQWSPGAYVLSNMFFTITFYVIALVYMVALGEIRFRLLPPWSSKIRKVHGAEAINEHRGASDAYFKQLNNAW
ncbi:hypothetical protein V3C99_013000 [Haemonchus contortus]